MAFEDRCSPQSAPSPPPGIPHSPHNTKMLLSPSATDLNSSSHSNGSSFAADHEMSMPVAARRSSPAMLRVKEERLESLAEPSDAQTATPIAFSITNILSHSFGSRNPSRKSSTEKRSGVLFRPYDDDVLTSAKRQELRSARVESDEEEEINVADPEPLPAGGEAIDFSSQALRDSLVQGHQPLPFTHPLHPQPQHLSYFQSSAFNYYQRLSLSDEVLAKYPPLGNLCKTVSQIGQSPRNVAIVSPMAALAASQKKASELAAAAARPESSSSAGVSPAKESSARPQPSNSLDSGMESSDDAKSETSSKDENGSQLWPAWIYCTRYSDRPSSGTLSIDPSKALLIYGVTKIVK